MRIAIERSYARAEVDVYIQFPTVTGADGVRSYLEVGIDDALEYRAIPRGATAPIAGRMTLDDSQELLDMLWGAGFRPTNGGSVADIVDAKDQHIADLRGVLKAGNLIDHG